MSAPTSPFHRLVTALGVATIPVVLAAVPGCHSQEPASPSVGLTHAVNPPELPRPPNGSPRTEVHGLYNLWIGDSILQSCKGPSPFFEFDASETGSREQPTMQNLATCMQDGPLRGKRVRLVGHTDPRGTASYNDKLGLERAERVKRYLVHHGVAPDRVDVTTAGEADASSAPKNWPSDRRVAVQLAE